MPEIIIRTMQKDDIEKIVCAFDGPADGGFDNYVTRCYKQNQTRERVSFVAFVHSEVAGYVHVIFKSAYPYFVERNIPEINDLRVLPAYRRQGVGKRLLEACEKFASANYEHIGLGVGLYKDYGSAQRLYAKSGYVPDGQGLMYKNAPVKPGRDVFVDDDLLIYLYKKIR